MFKFLLNLQAVGTLNVILSLLNSLISETFCSFKRVPLSSTPQTPQFNTTPSVPHQKPLSFTFLSSTPRTPQLHTKKPYLSSIQANWGGLLNWGVFGVELRGWNWGLFFVEIRGGVLNWGVFCVKLRGFWCGTEGIELNWGVYRRPFYYDVIYRGDSFLFSKE